MSALAEWIEEQVGERGWTFSELARRSDLSPASVSQVLSGYQKPGLQFCFGVAKGLDEPPETVLRLAGYLPIKPAQDEELEEIAYYYSRMTPEGREYFRRIARAMGDGKLRGGDEVVS